MPCHHALTEALRAYISAAGIADDHDKPFDGSPPGVEALPTLGAVATVGSSLAFDAARQSQLPKARRPYTRCLREQRLSAHVRIMMGLLSRLRSEPRPVKRVRSAVLCGG
jgi:hypothetical protein